MTQTHGAYFVTRTIRALELLAVAPRTNAELAELIGVHQRTSRRVLARLSDEGYVVKLPGYRGRFALTRRLPALGMCALANADQPPTRGSTSERSGANGEVDTLAVAGQGCALCILPVIALPGDSRAGAAGASRHNATRERSAASR